MKQETITALLFAPGAEPFAVQLYKNRAFLRAVVNIGLDDDSNDLNIHILDEDSCVLYCRFAPLRNGKINRSINDKLFFGTFVIVGHKGNELCPLPDKALASYRQQYRQALPISAVESTEALFAYIDALWEEVPNL